MKLSLVIGMGIGQLYKEVLTNLGHEVITVDVHPDKRADYTSLKEALASFTDFDTVHICTPNFTHQDIAEQVAPQAGIVFVEKPGFKTAEDWADVVKRFPDTKFMMVKNNMWRDNVKDLRVVADGSDKIILNWINMDRVPNPGTWFTTKELAYGGVSKDLMPHLLSLMAVMDPDYKDAKVEMVTEKQEWELADLTRSDYGTVNAEGTYDVDDFYQLEYTLNGRTWILTSDWRSMQTNEQNIKFSINEDYQVVSSLGFCPNEAYQNMIADAIGQIENDKFWEDQYNVDIWIHEQINL